MKHDSLGMISHHCMSILIITIQCMDNFMLEQLELDVCQANDVP